MHLATMLLQNSPDSQAIQQAVLGVMAIMPVLLLIGLAVVMVPIWFICKKAGFSPWLSLLIVVPFGGLVLLYILAFSQWHVVPVAQVGWAPQGGPTPPYPPSYPPQG